MDRAVMQQPLIHLHVYIKYGHNSTMYLFQINKYILLKCAQLRKVLLINNCYEYDESMHNGDY